MLNVVEKIKQYYERLAAVFPGLKRVSTPTVIQMEAVECGAAALKIVLDYFGRRVPLEELRIQCGVSRDGSKASNILKAARKYGIEGKGFKREPEQLYGMPLPMIIHWNFNHFVVLEGFSRKKVFINDPGRGPQVVTHEEFDSSFTGIALTLQPTEAFQKGGANISVVRELKRRLRGSETAYAFIVLTGLGLVIPGLVLPVFTRVFIDNILIKHMTDWVKPLLIGMALTAIIRGALSWLQKYYLLRFQTKLSLSMTSKFFWHLLRLPMEFYMQRFGGEVGSRLMINDRVAQLISGRITSTMVDVMMIGFYAIIMFQYDVMLTCVAICTAGFNIAALKYIARKRKDNSKRLIADNGKLTGASMGGLMMIETLKASGSEADFFSRWAGYQATMLNSMQSLGIYTAYISSVPTLLSAFSNTLILVLGGLKIMNGEMSIGLLVAFQSLMSSFIGPVNNLVNLGSTLQEVEADLNRLEDVLNYEPESNAPNDCLSDEEIDHVVKLQGTLELRGVSFGYSRLAEPLLKDFDLTLNSGQRVAIVGSSGSGKSTVAKIISGLYKPWEGQVFLDGQPYDRLPRSVISNSLAMVDQDIFLFGGTVRENLTMWDSTIPEASVTQAAKDACIHSEVASRAHGYDSTVQEGGGNFSGGQRQRLEIARALTTNPSLLVLDEATSALDPLTEKEIDDNLRRRGCTCFIVAHRLSTIRDCDEIIVLEEGTVVERGSHEELVEKDGTYAKLIAM